MLTATKHNIPWESWRGRAKTKRNETIFPFQHVASWRSGGSYRFCHCCKLGWRLLQLLCLLLCLLLFLFLLLWHCLAARFRGRYNRPKESEANVMPQWSPSRTWSGDPPPVPIYPPILREKKAIWVVAPLPFLEPLMLSLFVRICCTNNMKRKKCTWPRRSII